MRRLLVLLAFATACSPASFVRELQTRSAGMNQPAADPVHDIVASAHGGLGSERPGETARSPLPADGSQVVADTIARAGAAATGENRSQLCGIPGKEGSASAYCLGRYDVVRVKQQKKGPAVNTRSQ